MISWTDLRVLHEVVDNARERVVNRPSAGRVVAVPFRHDLLLDIVRGTPSEPRAPLTLQQCKVALLVFRRYSLQRDTYSIHLSIRHSYLKEGMTKTKSYWIFLFVYDAFAKLGRGKQRFLIERDWSKGIFYFYQDSPRWILKSEDARLKQFSLLFNGSSCVIISISASEYIKQSFKAT